MFQLTCSNRTTENLVSASQTTIKILRLLVKDDKYPSGNIRKVFETLKKCQINYKQHRRSNCDHPMCPICQGKKRAKLRARLNSALLTYLLGDPLKQHPTEEIQFKCIVHLTITVKDCEPKDIRSSFDKMHKGLSTLFRRKSFPVVGYFWINEMTVNKDPKSLYYGLCHPHIHIHILLAVDTSKPKSRLFWQKDQKDIVEYLRHELMDLMDTDYLPEIGLDTVLTGTEVENLTSNMFISRCKTLDEYSKHIEKDPNDFYSSPITALSNTFATASYFTKQASKALMVPNDDNTISFDSQKEITYYLLTDLEDLKLFGSSGSLKLPKESNIKSIEDFT